MRLCKLCAVCVAVLVAGACSSGSSKESAQTTTTPAVTKASYVARANTTCTTMRQRIAKLGNPPDDPIDLAAHFDQVHVIIGDALAELQLIAVPPGEAARIDAVYATVDKLQKDAPAYSAALRARNEAAVVAARKQIAADQTRASAAAAKYGLTACSF